MPAHRTPALLAALASLLAPAAEAGPCWDGLWAGREEAQQGEARRGGRQVELIASGNEVVGFFADGRYRPVRARTPDGPCFGTLEPLAFAWPCGRATMPGSPAAYPEGEAHLAWTGDGTARLTLRERGLEPVTVRLVRG